MKWEQFEREEIKVLIDVKGLGDFKFNHNENKSWNPSAMFEKLLQKYEGKKIYINIKISEIQ